MRGDKKGKNVKRNMDDCIRMVRWWNEGLEKASRKYYFIVTLNDLVVLVKEGRAN